MFYGTAEPLTAARHGSLSLKQDTGYAFAKNAMVLPLNAVEFHVAQQHFPIVFLGEDVPMPFAVVGVRQDENLFVSDGGVWAQGCYVPAYLRRYPFIFAEGPDGSELTLCIDVQAPMVEEGDVQPLFVDSEPSELTNRALEFCSAYNQEYRATRDFCDACRERTLFTVRRADVALQSGERFALEGIRVIDESRFNDLPDEVFVDWRRKGWLAPIYYHFASQHRWAGLVDRGTASAEGASEPPPERKKKGKA